MNRSTAVPLRTSEAQDASEVGRLVPRRFNGLLLPFRAYDLPMLLL